ARGSLARFGLIDMRAQTEVPSALRSDTPTRVFKRIVVAKGRLGKHDARSAIRLTLACTLRILSQAENRLLPRTGAAQSEQSRSPIPGGGPPGHGSLSVRKPISGKPTARTWPAPPAGPQIVRCALPPPSPRIRGLRSSCRRDRGAQRTPLLG